MNPVVITWLVDAATLLGLALLAACAAFGLALVIAPRVAILASGALNRRFSGRRAMRPLEIPRPTERAFYRHHRLLGAVLVLAVAAFFLLYFLNFPRDSVLAALSRQYGHGPAVALLQAAEWFLLLANGLIGVLGMHVLIRPSVLKPVEAWANRWISTRQGLKGLEQEHDPVDRFAVKHPRITGVLILVGVTYITLGLLVVVG